MKTIFNFFFVCAVGLYMCSCDGWSKNYSVSATDGNIYVKMHSPTLGLTGINKVGFDGFTYDEVEEEVFDEIRDRDYNGDYKVWVILQTEDSYGNYQDNEPIHVSTLNGADVKRYASFQHFKGATKISSAFPWNRDSGSKTIIF